MARLHILTLAVVALLCLLPSFLSSFSSSSSHILVAAAKSRTAAGGGSPSYATENRDLDDEDDLPLDGDDDTPRRGSKVSVSSGNDGSSDESDHKVTLRILHATTAVGETRWQPRGTVTLNFAASAQASKRGGGKAIVFSPDQKVSKKSLSSLIDAEALYRVAFVAEGQKDEEAIVTSVQPCALAASHFHETFTFHSDPYGRILSVSYRTPLTSCLPPSEQAAILNGPDATTLLPKGRVSFGRPGEKAKTHIRPGFDAASQAQAQAVGSDAPPPAATQQPERNADGTAVAPPQSFWSKYWIYIVPLGIFMVVQAVVAPPEGPAGEGAGGGAARK